MILELKEELYFHNLLAQLFLPHPSKDLLQGLTTISVSDDAEDTLGRALRTLSRTSQQNADRLEQWQEELAVEFTRLFIGPKSPPAVPFASFYLSENRSLMTHDTIEVRKKYMESGMAVKQLYQFPDDHISIELEFIQHLTKEALDASINGNDAMADKLVKARNEFIYSHMQLWVPKFIDMILENTVEKFYIGAAYLLHGVATDIH